MKTNPEAIKKFCKFFYAPPIPGYMSVPEWLEFDGLNSKTSSELADIIEGNIRHIGQMWNKGNGYDIEPAKPEDQIHPDDIPELTQNFIASLKRDEK